MHMHMVTHNACPISCYILKIGQETLATLYIQSFIAI